MPIATRQASARLPSVFLLHVTESTRLCLNPLSQRAAPPYDEPPHPASSFCDLTYLLVFVSLVQEHMSHKDSGIARNQADQMPSSIGYTNNNGTRTAKRMLTWSSRDLWSKQIAWSLGLGMVCRCLTGLVGHQKGQDIKGKKNTKQKLNI